MNAVTITIRDRSKTATCRETLSMCGQYEVTVEPAWTGPGFLVLHDRIDLPRVWPKCPDTCWAAPLMEEGGVFTYAKLVDGASEKDGQGVPTEAGLLDLRDREIVRKLSKFTMLGGVCGVPFSVYAANSAGGMNMVGTGYMNILVAEPYSSKNGKDLSLFKGERGEDAPRVESFDKTGEDADGNWKYAMTLSDGTSFEFVIPKGADGKDALTTYIREENADAYHMLRVRRTETGEFVLLIEKDAASAEMSFDEATIAANDYMKQAGWYALGRFTEDDPPVLLVAGAKQYAENAAASASSADESAQNAANSATGAATSRGKADEAREDAEDARDDAVAAKIVAEGYRDEAETYKDQSYQARTDAIAARDATIAAGSSAQSAIQSAKTEALGAIASALGDDETPDTALGDIEEARSSAVTDVGDALTAATAAIGSARDSAVDAVSGDTDSAKSEAIDAINDARDQAIADVGDASDIIQNDNTFSGNNSFALPVTLLGGVVGEGLARTTGTLACTTADKTETIQGLAPGGLYALMFFLVNDTTTSGIFYINGKAHESGIISTKHGFCVRVFQADANGAVSFTYKANADNRVTAHYVAITL